MNVKILKDSIKIGFLESGKERKTNSQKYLTNLQYSDTNRYIYPLFR